MVVEQTLFTMVLEHMGIHPLASSRMVQPMVRRILGSVLLRMVRWLGSFLAGNVSGTSYGTASGTSPACTRGHMERTKTPDRIGQDVCGQDHQPRRTWLIIDFSKRPFRRSDQNSFKSFNLIFRHQPHQQDRDSRKDCCDKKQCFSWHSQGNHLCNNFHIKTFAGIKKQLPQTGRDLSFRQRQLVVQQKHNITFDPKQRKRLKLI